MFRLVFGSEPSGTGIAGLPSVRPVDDPAPEPRAEWPLILVMAVIAFTGAYALIDGEWGRYDGTAGRPGAGGLTLPGVPTLKDTRAPAEGSYLEPQAFAAALARLRKAAGPRAEVQLLRVDTGQVWSVLRRRDGESRVLRVTGGEVSDDAAGDTGTGGFALESVDRTAPARVVRSLRRRFDVPASRVDHLVLAALPGATGWSVFLRDPPRQFRADRGGYELRRIG